MLPVGTCVSLFGRHYTIIGNDAKYPRLYDVVQILSVKGNPVQQCHQKRQIAFSDHMKIVDLGTIYSIIYKNRNFPLLSGGNRISRVQLNHSTETKSSRVD